MIRSQLHISFYALCTLGFFVLPGCSFVRRGQGRAPISAPIKDELTVHGVRHTLYQFPHYADLPIPGGAMMKSVSTTVGVLLVYEIDMTLPVLYAFCKAHMEYSGWVSDGMVESEVCRTMVWYRPQHWVVIVIQSVGKEHQHRWRVTIAAQARSVVWMAAHEEQRSLDTGVQGEDEVMRV